MRLIETTNSHVVFKEIDDNGVLISMQGFNYGTLHYKITNSKVTFYPNDLDSPWKVEVWSVNLPVMVDGKIVDADGIDAALASVMSDNWQGQIDGLQAKDAELEAAIGREEARAMSAEDAIDDRLTAEIVRATSAEDILQDNIDGEEARARAEEDALGRLINAETVRAQGAEAALQNALNNEITRSLSADTNFDNRLDAEIIRSTSVDAQILATMATKSDLGNYYTKAESDAKYCTKDYVDGKFSNSYTKPETDALLATKADKVSAITNAIYDSGNTVINFYNSNNAVVASIDASAFIVDGMVDNVVISGNNLVVTFNVDAGKQEIVVPLTNIFDPTNYYTKVETDDKFATKSGLEDLSGKVETISGSVTTLSDDVNYISGVVDTFSAATYTKSDVDAKLSDKQDVSGMSAYTLTSVTNALSATVTSHTANTTIHVTAQDKTNWNGKQDKLTAGSGIDITNNVISVSSPKIWTGTQEEFDALTTKDPNCIYLVS